MTHRTKPKQRFLKIALQRYPFCQWCGHHIVRFRKRTRSGQLFATVDHVLARTQGGTNKWENFVLSCEPCNVVKGANLVERVPYGPKWTSETPKDDLMAWNVLFHFNSENNNHFTPMQALLHLQELFGLEIRQKQIPKYVLPGDVSPENDIWPYDTEHYIMVRFRFKCPEAVTRARGARIDAYVGGKYESKVPSL